MYLPFEKLKQLLEDYEKQPEVREQLNTTYDFNRIDVFLKAVRFAVENGLGILEATEVIEPDPFDLNESNCYSNLFNCDIDGALLYQEAANAQMSQIMQQRESEPSKRKGLLGKLFRK